MENATKALLIAGGILIAIVLITMGVYVYVGIHNAALAQDLLASQEQLAKFNKKYDAYNKELLHGTDIITLVNMAYEDSLRLKDIYNADLKSEELEIRIKAGEFDEIYLRQLSKSKDSSDKAKINDFKRRVFTCDEVKYNDDTGIISSMTFSEVPL